MSAHPFQQGAPLDEYCEWLVGRGGSVEDGENEWGRFRRLVSPDGLQHVIVAEMDEDEALMPSSIWQIDYRLGLTSPWRERDPGETD